MLKSREGFFAFLQDQVPLVELRAFLAELQLERGQLESELPCFPFEFGAGSQEAFPRDDFRIFLDPLSIDFSFRYDSLGFFPGVGDHSDGSAA
jgi:hypothetical protein